MRFIPNACGPLDIPDECTDRLWAIGDCLVQTGLTAIEPFLTGEGDCPFHGFVGFGQQPMPDDLCNQLTVMLNTFTPALTKDCVGVFRLSYRVEVVFSDYPIIDYENVQNYIPSVGSQEIANRWLLAVGASLAQGYLSELSEPQCTFLQRAEPREMSQLRQSGPRGGCAGWNFDVNLTFIGGL